MKKNAAPPTPIPARAPVRSDDIIKCHGDGCKKRELCLRFTTPPKAKWQAYFLIGVNIKNVDECQFFRQKVIADVPAQSVEAGEPKEPDLFSNE